MTQASVFNRISAIFLAGLVLPATAALAAELPLHAEAHYTETVSTGLQFPEGPIFIGDTLYLTDYAASAVLRFVDGRLERIWYQAGCGANGLATLRGELLVACYDSGTIVRITNTGRTVEMISHDAAGDAFPSPNDLAVDTRGGVYFSASGDAFVSGKVFYRAPDGAIEAVADGIHYANGLAVSQDGKRLYLAESQRHRLLAYSIGKNGALSHRAVFSDLQGLLADARHPVITPDGLRLDAEGRLFVGLYDGGGFAVLTADGTLVAKVELPGQHHANLALAPDGRSVFVTAADEAGDGLFRGQLLKISNPAPH